MKTNSITIAAPAVAAITVDAKAWKQGLKIFSGANFCEVGHLFRELHLVMPGDEVPAGLIQVQGIYIEEIVRHDPAYPSYVIADIGVSPTLWAEPSEQFQAYWDEFSKGLYAGYAIPPACFRVNGCNDGSATVSVQPQGDCVSARLCGEIVPKSLGALLSSLGVVYGHPAEKARYEGDWAAYRMSL